MLFGYNKNLEVLGYNKKNKIKGEMRSVGLR